MLNLGMQTSLTRFTLFKLMFSFLVLTLSTKI